MHPPSSYPACLQATTNKWLLKKQNRVASKKHLPFNRLFIDCYLFGLLVIGLMQTVIGLLAVILDRLISCGYWLAYIFGGKRALWVNYRRLLPCLWYWWIACIYWLLYRVK
jgi:hypothetical protein